MQKTYNFEFYNNKPSGGNFRFYNKCWGQAKSLTP